MWCEFSRQIIEGNKGKAKQSRITFDTQIKIVLIRLKIEPIRTKQRVFSRALLSRALLLGISSNVPISRCNNFGFGLTTLNQRALYVFHSRQVSDYILVRQFFPSHALWQ